MNKPVDAGPAWDALGELDLNRHREDIVEDTKRASEKTEWCRTHRDDPRYPDAKAREESATGTVVYNLPAVLTHARRGMEVLQGSMKDRPQAFHPRTNGHL